ncbi:MAG: hypothetical protein ACO36I_18955, partial [Candidatus Latescibacterota bacterium]
MLNSACILCLFLFFSSSTVAAQIIHHEGPDLQKTIDRASSYATILCNRNERLTISATILINKPLTIRDVVAERCERPLEISNTNQLTLENVRVIHHSGGQPAVHIDNCSNVFTRDFIITGKGNNSAVLIENTGDIVIDGLTLNKGTESFANGLTYLISKDIALTNLRIQNVAAPNAQNAGIVLNNTSQSGTLSSYTITGNTATVSD